MRPLLDRALGWKALRHVYDRAKALHEKHEAKGTLFGWLDSSLTALHHTYRMDVPEGFAMPSTGPLIVVANYSRGLLDPIVVGHVIAKMRPDLKIMADASMAELPEMQPHVIEVDSVREDGSPKRNFSALREAIRHLRAGGALLVFPSGDVARSRVGRGVREKPWTEHIGGLVRRGQAAVLPIFFPANRGLWQRATSFMTRHLRTRLMVRDLLRGRDGTTVLRAGRVLAAATLKKFADDTSLTHYLRLHTLVLDRRGTARRTSTAHADASPVLPSVDNALLCREVEALRSRGALLAAQGGLQAFIAEAEHIPHILHEIGRLRELTFRAVGEGTGSEIDLDKFDRYYLHLFLWDDKAQRVAGAYRLGKADMILREHGPRGLYTNTLFKFSDEFLAKMENAVELGRSFIVVDYQRHVAALPLLWKAVITWMGLNPHYRQLFGPVSISQDYDELSQQLIVTCIHHHHSDAAMRDLVKPRRPFRSKLKGPLKREVKSLQMPGAEDLSSLIASLEADGKGVPVLLKHYLRLDGTILSFNVDKDFAGVLDGLVLVDMLKMDARLPSKMMGAELWAAYKAHHCCK